VTDTEFVLFALLAVAVLVFSAFTTVPERRNPHIDRRRRSAWWRRNPS